MMETAPILASISIEALVSITTAFILIIAYINRIDGATKRNREVMTEEIQNRVAALTALEARLAAQRKEDEAVHRMSWQALNARMNELHASQIDMGKDIKLLLQRSTRSTRDSH